MHLIICMYGVSFIFYDKQNSVTVSLYTIYFLFYFIFRMLLVIDSYAFLCIQSMLVYPILR
jgi:hypothetical protein